MKLNAVNPKEEKTHLQIKQNELIDEPWPSFPFSYNDMKQNAYEQQ